MVDPVTDSVLLYLGGNTTGIHSFTRCYMRAKY